MSHPPFSPKHFMRFWQVDHPTFSELPMKKRIGTSEHCVLCKCAQLLLCNNNYKLSGVLWDRILACGQSCVNVPIHYCDLLLIMMQNPGLFSSHGTSALIIRMSPLGTRDWESLSGVLLGKSHSSKSWPLITSALPNLCFILKAEYAAAVFLLLLLFFFFTVS